MPDPPSPRIIIVGGGIIGASISYHLALLGSPCTILEQHSVACAASGKAAGFLAKDWNDSTPLRALTRHSFELHKNFAASVPTCVHYRPLEAYSVSLIHFNQPLRSKTRRRNTTIPRSLRWLNGAASVSSAPHCIGTKATTAQVQPRLLTHALLQQATQLAGSTVRLARVENVRRAEDDACWNVYALDKNTEAVNVLPADVVVFAMGPWTSRARAWFPQIPVIEGQKAASLVVTVGKSVGETALFMEYEVEGGVREVEVYPREEREVYLSMSSYFEERMAEPGKVQVHERNVRELKEVASGISTELGEVVQGDGDGVEAQACHLPVSEDGLPVIGPLEGVQGIWVATGHSCWGVLNSMGTGFSVAEMILKGTSEIDLSPFSPRRFG